MGEKLEEFSKKLNTSENEGKKFFNSAEQLAIKNNTPIEDAVLDILQSGGYNEGMSVELKNAIKEKDYQTLYGIAHSGGWE